MEVSQTRALADALLMLRRLLGGAGRGGKELRLLLDKLEEDMDREVKKRIGKTNEMSTTERMCLLGSCSNACYACYACKTKLDPPAPQPVLTLFFPQLDLARLDSCSCMLFVC